MAVEAVVDRFGSEDHELSGRTKDMGSAAVFVASCMAGTQLDRNSLWTLCLSQLILSTAANC